MLRRDHPSMVVNKQQKIDVVKGEVGLRVGGYGAQLRGYGVQI